MHTPPEPPPGGARRDLGSVLARRKQSAHELAVLHGAMNMHGRGWADQPAKQPFGLGRHVCPGAQQLLAERG